MRAKSISEQVFTSPAVSKIGESLKSKIYLVYRALKRVNLKVKALTYPAIEKGAIEFYIDDVPIAIYYIEPESEAAEKYPSFLNWTLLYKGEHIIENSIKFGPIFTKIKEFLNLKEGTSNYSRNLPYHNYKSLFTLVEGDEEILNDAHSAVGYGKGSLQTPQTQRRMQAKKTKQKQEEIKENVVHPDDKIGQMMLKKMGVPNYFESKGLEVHQKTVDKKDKKGKKKTSRRSKS